MVNNAMISVSDKDSGSRLSRTIRCASIPGSDNTSCSVRPVHGESCKSSQVRGSGMGQACISGMDQARWAKHESGTGQAWIRLESDMGVRHESGMDQVGVRHERGTSQGIGIAPATPWETSTGVPGPRPAECPVPSAQCPVPSATSGVWSTVCFRPERGNGPALADQRGFKARSVFCVPTTSRSLSDPENGAVPRVPPSGPTRGGDGGA